MIPTCFSLELSYCYGYGTTVAFGRLWFPSVAGMRHTISAKGEEMMKSKLTAVLSSLLLAALALNKGL